DFGESSVDAVEAAVVEGGAAIGPDPAFIVAKGAAFVAMDAAIDATNAAEAAINVCGGANGERNTPRTRRGGEAEGSWRQRRGYTADKIHSRPKTLIFTGL